jgi:hypothetical protein
MKDRTINWYSEGRVLVEGGRGTKDIKLREYG